jgi:hypothetical protein
MQIRALSTTRTRRVLMQTTFLEAVMACLSNYADSTGRQRARILVFLSSRLARECRHIGHLLEGLNAFRTRGSTADDCSGSQAAA